MKREQKKKHCLLDELGWIGLDWIGLQFRRYESRDTIKLVQFQVDALHCSLNILTKGSTWESVCWKNQTETHLQHAVRLSILCT